MLPTQATSYQLDFERERRDKEEAMVKFAKETKIWKGDVANLSERLNALGLEHSETLDQLDFLKKCSGLEGHKREVSNGLRMQATCISNSSACNISACIIMHCFVLCSVTYCIKMKQIIQV